MYAEQVTLDSDRRVPQPSDQARPGAERPEQGEVAVLRTEIDGLYHRLATQPVIEQAKGILMGFYGIDPDTAFTVLVRWSQQTNTKLRLLADDLVTTASRDGGEPRARLQELLQQLTASGATTRGGKERG